MVCCGGYWAVLFVVYILGYYGARFVEVGIVDGFEGTHLANGFILGDDVGNLALVIHILIASLIMAAGQIQLVPHIRKKWVLRLSVVVSAVWFLRLIDLAGFWQPAG